MSAFKVKRFCMDVLLIGAVLYLMFQFGGCGSGLGVGYRSVLVVRNAGDATSKALAAACEAKRQDCKAKHGVKTEGYKSCMENCLKALKAWRLYAKPAINTSLRAAFGVLEVARARKKKQAPWLEALKPGACQLVKMVQEWRGLMPKDAASLLTLLKGVEGLVCK